jgi:hypothetical protein
MSLFDVANVIASKVVGSESETAVVKATRTDLLPPKEKWVRGAVAKS